MSTSLTVRDIDPADKSWLRREARHVGEFRNTGVTTVAPGSATPR